LEEDASITASSGLELATVPPIQNKILVIRGGAIGDFILTLPVLAALRQQFPKTRVEVLGYRHIAQLAVAGGLADDARSIEARPLAGFFARQGALAEDLREYFASFAIIISYLYDPDEIFQSNVTRCSKAQFICGPHRPNDQQGVHATEVFLKPLERLAIFEADPIPHLTLAPRLPVPDPHLALHPGSGSERKNWPEAHWAELLQLLLRATPLRLLLVGGEAEGDRLQRLAAPLPTERITIAQSLPLVALAQRLQECHSFVGHDSGIAHLAAALGLPGVVLWRDSIESVWRPRSERMRILRESGSRAAHEVIRELSHGVAGVGASPCLPRDDRSDRRRLRV
jgi:heptosyltransferase-2